MAKLQYFHNFRSKKSRKASTICPDLHFPGKLLIFAAGYSSVSSTKKGVHMSRTILAGFLGAIVLFAWGFVSWVILPFHGQTTHALPNEDAVAAALKSGNAESGAYRIPAIGGDEITKKAEMEKMKTGPIAWIQ